MTTTFALILVLVLIGGWLLGLASSPGGARWKQRYAAEREAHAASRRDADTRIAAADARTTELEREHARLATAAPAAAGTVAPRTTSVIAAPRATSAVTVRPAHPVGERRGWFDFNRPPVR